MENLTILIIDDDKVDLMTYIRFLKENSTFNCKILTAESSKKGLALWKENIIDCILLDYNLPGKDGLEILKTIKNSDNDYAAIIMITGFGNEHIAVKAMKAGAADYIIKDEVNDHILITTINNAMNQLKLKKHAEMYRKLEIEKKLAEDQFQLKNEFLANMSHELRTPLNPIMGYAQLLYDESLGPITEEQKDAMATILESSNHLAKIIDNAIKITEFEMGKIILKPEEFKLAEPLQEVIDSLHTVADQKQIKIHCQIHKNISKVFLDRTRFQEIIYNYLSNALKFTPKSGQIHIRVKEESADQFRLEIEDSGIGIEPNNIEKLFITFQQLDASILKKYQGTGLGLSLTKHIADALGGYVGVTSTLGQGSIFYVVLPKKQYVPKKIPVHG